MPALILCAIKVVFFYECAICFLNVVNVLVSTWHIEICLQIYIKSRLVGILNHQTCNVSKLRAGNSLKSFSEFHVESKLAI